MDKKYFSRNFRYPSAELRDQVRAAVKERGFRSEQAFLIAACEHEIRQGANTEATEQFEARVAATLTNLAKQVQGLQTLAHAQVALTDVFLKYVITCVVEPLPLRPGRFAREGQGVSPWKQHSLWRRKLMEQLP